MRAAKDAFKLLVGRAAEVVLPDLGREIDEARHTTRAPRLKRAILHSRIRRAQRLGDTAEIERTLNAYWRGDESWYYDSYVDARFSFFCEHHAVVIDQLRDHIDGSFHRLVEIGCGDGRTLAYAAARLPSVADAVGVDVNAAVIGRNQAAQPANGRLTFVNADAREWLVENPRPGSIVLTNNGVLEFLSQDSLDRLLRELASQAPAAIALIEPIDADHDLSARHESYAYGWERAFSHDHRTRLTEAGFDVRFEKDMQAGGLRWMLMVGILK